jgi:putative tRNA adenosine deaminase-associated protein
VSTFAAVFARSGKTWRGTEVELGDVAVIDDVTDLMIDFAVERGGDLSLLLVEADDEWFAIVRAEEDGEPRVYLSDGRAVHDHPLAAVLSEAGGLGAPQPAESAGARPNPAPDGDAELLTDLGIGDSELRSLSVGGGVLPSDVLAVVAERAGFGELLDEMRL